MTRPKKRICSALFLTAVLALTSMAYGASVNTQRFRESGRVDSVDFKTMLIVIGEKTNRLQPATRVYSATGASVPLSAIRRGAEVQYNLSTPGPDRIPVVREMLLGSPK